MLIKKDMGKKPLPQLPEGYKLQDGIAFGSRLPGLLEIAFFNPKAQNAITGEG